MIKKSLCMLIILIIIPLAYSLTEEEIFSKTVKDGQTETIDGTEYNFLFVPPEGILIKYGLSKILVKVNTCKYQDDLHVCVGNMSFSYRNHTLWKDIYEAEIEINQLKGDIEISELYELEEFEVGESIDSEISIQNSGSVQITEVNFSNLYPDAFKISGLEGGCKIKNNLIYWKGSLDPLVKRTCAFVLTGIYPYTHKSEPQVSYIDKGEKKSETIEGSTLKILNYSLQLEGNFNTGLVDIGEPININLLLSNTKENSKISVDKVNIIISEDLQVDTYSQVLEKSGNTYSWNGYVSPDEIINLSINMVGLNQGKKDIIVEKSFRDGNKNRFVSTIYSINVTCDCIEIDVDYEDIDDDDQMKVFRIYLNNPSQKNDFSKIDITVKTNIPDAEEYHKVLPKLYDSQFHQIVNTKIPLAWNDTMYYYLNLDYQTPFGEEISEEKYYIFNESLMKTVDYFEIPEKIIEEISEPEIEEPAIMPEEEEKKSIFNIFKSDEERSSFGLAILIIASVIVIGLIIGAIKVRSRGKKQIPTEKTLVIFLFIAFGSLLFFPLSMNITGMAVSGLSSNISQENVSLLLIIITLFVTTIFVLHRKHPFTKPKS